MTNANSYLDNGGPAPTTDEMIAALEAMGYEVRRPHPSTLTRRRHRQQRTFAVISRSGKAYTASDGTEYGEVSAAQQRRSDAGVWRAGKAVRDELLPMTVAVGGIVKRIYEVNGWHQVDSKWEAELGPMLSNDELDANYPDYPYRLGDSCPTRIGGAYRPESY